MSLLKKGDKVVINDRYKVDKKHKDKVFVVKSQPFLASGKTCVFLEGLKDVYEVDGLTKANTVPKKASRKSGSSPVEKTLNYIDSEMDLYRKRLLDGEKLTIEDSVRINAFEEIKATLLSQ